MFTKVKELFDEVCKAYELEALYYISPNTEAALIQKRVTEAVKKWKEKLDFELDDIEGNLKAEQEFDPC